MFFFFFNDTATTEIYTLSLHDALPILKLALALLAVFGLLDSIAYAAEAPLIRFGRGFAAEEQVWLMSARPDRKSTRLNSSHVRISYAVFCLKKKKKDIDTSHSK